MQTGEYWFLIEGEQVSPLMSPVPKIPSLLLPHE